MSAVDVDGRGTMVVLKGALGEVWKGVKDRTPAPTVSFIRVVVDGVAVHQVPVAASLRLSIVHDSLTANTAAKKFSKGQPVAAMTLYPVMRYGRKIVGPGLILHIPTTAEVAAGMEYPSFDRPHYVALLTESLRLIARKSTAVFPSGEPFPKLLAELAALSDVDAMQFLCNIQLDNPRGYPPYAQRCSRLFRAGMESNPTPYNNSGMLYSVVDRVDLVRALFASLAQHCPDDGHRWNIGWSVADYETIDAITFAFTHVRARTIFGTHCPSTLKLMSPALIRLIKGFGRRRSLDFPISPN